MTAGLVVVGGSIAGVRAVEGARSTGYDGPITLITAEPHLPYDRTSLSKDLLAVDGASTPPSLRDEEAWADLRVTLRTGVTASGLDAAAKVVRTDAGEVAYDALVIATGAAARLVPDSLPMRSLADALAIRDAFEEAESVLVIGAGFIGAEVATAALNRGLKVTVIDAAPYPLGRAVGPVGGEALAAIHRSAEIDLHLGASMVGGVDGEIELSDGTRLRPDVIVSGIGAVAHTAWLADSGLAIDPTTSAVITDARLRTNLPDVWAAGDVALVDGELGQHWVAAADQGRIAGISAVGGEPQSWAAVAFAWSHWYGHRIQYVGACVGDQELFVPDQGVSGIVLVRSGDRLAGVLAVDRPGDAAKARRLIASGATWDAALEAYSVVASSAS